MPERSGKGLRRFNRSTVNHQQNFVNKLDSPGTCGFRGKTQGNDEKINLENTYLSIVNEQLAFLPAEQWILVARIRKPA
jgi:hypothetical protein